MNLECDPTNSINLQNLFVRSQAGREKQYKSKDKFVKQKKKQNTALYGQKAKKDRGGRGQMRKC